MSLSTLPFSTEGLDHNEGAFEHGIIRLHGRDGEHFIKSGDSFELKTNDVTKKPLPSFKLLELQWFLTRVMGMAGAAVPYEADHEDDDSDREISNFGLDEEADTSFVSDSLPAGSPEFLRKYNPLPSIEGSKHHTEEAEEGEEDRARSEYVV